MALDYGAVSSDLTALLAAIDFSTIYALPTSQKITKVRVLEEAMAVEMGLNQMPLVNVKLVSATSVITNIPAGYYDHIMLECTVFAFDFTSFRSATTLRDAILRLCMTTVRGARAFSSGLSTSTVGEKIQFGAMAPDNGGGHVAIATFIVDAEGYVS